MKIIAYSSLEIYDSIPKGERVFLKLQMVDQREGYD
jgi:hypothetical protein